MSAVITYFIILFICLFNLFILLLVFEEVICHGIQMSLQRTWVHRHSVLAVVVGKEDILFRFILFGYFLNFLFYLFISFFLFFPFFIFWDGGLCWLVSVDLTQTRVIWEGGPSTENCLYQIGQEASLWWSTFLIYGWCGRAQPRRVVPVLSTRVVLWVCANCGEGVATKHFSTASVLVPPPSSYLNSCSWLPLMMGGHLCHVLNFFLCKLLWVTVLPQQQNPS